jgi:hypothetical protein
MIDVLAEELIRPIEAAALFPRSRRGKRIHVSAVYRFMTTGCRGVILESVKSPRLATSRQAIARFIDRLSNLDRPNVSAIRSASVRKPMNHSVEAELDRLGIR